MSAQIVPFGRRQRPQHRFSTADRTALVAIGPDPSFAGTLVRIEVPCGGGSVHHGRIGRSQP